jgi:hypothetical protein
LTRELVSLPDGGEIALDWSTSSMKAFESDTPTVVVAHGLTGGKYKASGRYFNFCDFYVIGGKGKRSNIHVVNQDPMKIMFKI